MFAQRCAVPSGFSGEFSRSEHPLPLSGQTDLAKLMPLFQQLDMLQMTRCSYVEKAGMFYQILALLNHPSNKSVHMQTVQKLLALVIQDMGRKWTLEEMAEAVGYSKNYIIRLFRETLGQTPCQYFTELRMEGARELLKNSDITVDAIAEQCGFGAYTNLYKEFCRAEGCPPLKYRQRNRHGYWDKK